MHQGQSSGLSELRIRDYPVKNREGAVIVIELLLSYRKDIRLTFQEYINSCSTILQPVVVYRTTTL